MTPREVVARKLLDAFPGAADWDDQWPGVRKVKLIDADAILTALRDAGFAVVPREPTEVMLQAAVETGGGYRGAYRAMLAAAEGETR